MLKVINDLPANVLGIEASGEVTSKDYETVLVPALEEKLSTTKRVRFLYLFGQDFTDYTGGAAWEDAKVGLSHMTRFERVAVVTDVSWIGIAVKAFGFAMPGHVRVFKNSDLQDARDWVSEPPPTGDLAFEFNETQNVLILQPRGELDAADFKRISNEIDPHVAKQGALRGVMIVAEHFPGWDDFSAFGAHMRFVKDHQAHIKRLAIVTDDRLLSALPQIASHFLVPDVRQFDMNQHDEALAWVSQG